MRPESCFSWTFMTRFIAFCLGSLFATTIAFAQADSNAVVLSPRVGAEIDSLEREYFGLLLHVRDFRTARIVPGPTGHYSIVINDGERTSIMLTRAQFAALQSYINRFEHFQDTATRDSLVMLASLKMSWALS